MPAQWPRGNFPSLCGQGGFRGKPGLRVRAFRSPKFYGTFSIGSNAGFFYIVAYLVGSPDVAGTTVNTLVAV